MAYKLVLLPAVLLAVAVPCTAPAQAAAPPPGSTLPVFLDESLNASNAHAGEAIRASLTQRVPLPGGAYLSDKAKLRGTVIAVNAQTLVLRFDTLTLGEEAAPVRVKLLAAADWLDVEHTHDNLGSPDRGAGNPSQWTTEQIGGDEVYRANSIAKVYNRVSEPVGRADGTGVYGAPLQPGGLERAMGPFSTTSTGLYDLPGLSFGPQTPGAVTFGLTDGKWKLHSHSGLLLEVVP